MTDIDYVHHALEAASTDGFQTEIVYKALDCMQSDSCLSIEEAMKLALESILDMKTEEFDYTPAIREFLKK